MAYNRFCSRIFYSFGTVNIRQTTSGKVNVKVLEIYGVKVSSPRQFDLDRSKVKATETALWVLTPLGISYQIKQ